MGGSTTNQLVLVGVALFVPDSSATKAVFLLIQLKPLRQQTFMVNQAETTFSFVVSPGFADTRSLLLKNITSKGLWKKMSSKFLFFWWRFCCLLGIQKCNKKNLFLGGFLVDLPFLPTGFIAGGRGPLPRPAIVQLQQRLRGSNSDNGIGLKLTGLPSHDKMTRVSYSHPRNLQKANG